MITLYKTMAGVLTLLLFTSCATIFKGSSGELRVNSYPSGANISVDGVSYGTTPANLNVKRNRDYVFEFTRDGYEPIKLAVNKKFDLATSVVGNVFSWGIFGLVVDLASGAAYSLTPADIQANMNALAEHVPEGYEPKKDEIFVVMLTTEEWEAMQQMK